MKLPQIRWGRALLGVLLAEIALVAAAIAWVAFYSHVLHRGESFEFYQRYALLASPWVSVVVGIPVFFFVARWAGLRSPATAGPTAMTLFGVFLAIDLSLVLSSPGHPTLTPAFLIANYLVKFLACLFGGRAAARATALPL